MEEVFGHHGFWEWFAILLWGFLIQFTYKMHLAPNREGGFKWKYFWNDNTLDFVKNAILSFIILRVGDKQIHNLFVLIKEEIPRFPLDGEGMDVVISVSVISVVLSAILHRFFKKPISKAVAQKMHVHNENCGHLKK